MTDLERYGPWAVITGGSEGVGACFARRLAQSGINLVLVARKPGPLEATATECRELGVEVRTLPLDLARPAAAGDVLTAVADLEVGLLIHNAGANTHSERFLDGDPEAFGSVIDLNITTPLALVHALVPPMVERDRGGVILVGSMAGYLGSVRHTVYGGVKAFDRIFSEGLWVELHETGVDVLHLVLGVTRTPAMERVGLNFEVPGMHVSEPDDVAREGLEQLPHGPVHVVSGNERGLAARSDPDRAKIVLGTHRFMASLMGEA